MKTTPRNRPAAAGARCATSALMTLTAVMALMAAGATVPAHAGLFDDDEARRAIIELRSRVGAVDESAKARHAELQSALSAQSQSQTQALARLESQTAETLGLLRRSLLELNNQIEALRGEIATLRGANEQLAREVSDQQRRQRDLAQGVDDRLRRFEPVKVSLDGEEFLAEPEEKRQFDEAIAILRGGDFDKAATALTAFQRRYPGSGYTNAIRFWLGNAHYGRRDYKEAVSAFRAFVTVAPQHPRAPEALLAVANSQTEMKDRAGARKTLDELLKAYPQSEAARTGRERLAALR